MSETTELTGTLADLQNFTTAGVLPTPQQAKADDIDIIHTPFQHTELSDRGPASAKQRIQSTLDTFLSNGKSSELAPAPPPSPLVANAAAPQP